MSGNEAAAALAINLELRERLEYHAHHGAAEHRAAMGEACALAKRHGPILLAQYVAATKAEIYSFARALAVEGLPAAPITSDEQKPPEK